MPGTSRRRGAPRSASSDYPPRFQHIVHRLRGAIKRSRTSLASFMNMHGEQQSMRGPSQAERLDSRARGGGLFPCAAPVWRKPDRPRSARRAARWRRRVAAKAMVGIIVGVSSWVSLGGPARCPPELQPPNLAGSPFGVGPLGDEFVALDPPDRIFAGFGRQRTSRTRGCAPAGGASRLAACVSGRMPWVRSHTGRTCTNGRSDCETFGAGKDVASFSRRNF